MTASLIITRPEAQSESFAAEMAARWEGPLYIVISPLLRVIPLVPAIGAVEELIFTSANGVEAAQRLNIRKGLRAWCVGDKTGDLAKAAGFMPHVGPGDADGLVDTIIAVKPKGRLVHLRGKHSRGAVTSRLREAGVDCEDFVTYDQQPQMLNKDAQRALDGQKPVFFPLFSPRTATILREQGPFSAPVHVIALSKAVADAFGQNTARQITVADRPDMPAMLTATVDALHAQSGHMG
jgi:uroporphyrinogen-III synthase